MLVSPLILTLSLLTTQGQAKPGTCHGQRLYCGSSLKNMGTYFFSCSPLVINPSTPVLMAAAMMLGLDTRTIVSAGPGCCSIVA